MVERYEFKGDGIGFLRKNAQGIYVMASDYDALEAAFLQTRGALADIGLADDLDAEAMRNKAMYHYRATAKAAGDSPPETEGEPK